ncbi:hypothetical protein [Nonomuraea sp. NPDC050783]|uniref:hypothetical protein n=1 Tax=Nonomuraea sp. NPDC050783 TaxID=3154634 RepID=UPI003467D6E2
MSIGVCLVALAVLNPGGSGTGPILSWIFQAIVLVLGCVIMPGEVFTTRYIRAAVRKSDDPSLRGLDAGAFVDAAAKAYPSWFRGVIAARLVLATAGSLLVIGLLAMPALSARASGARAAEAGGKNKTVVPGFFRARLSASPLIPTGVPICPKPCRCIWPATTHRSPRR